MDVYIFDHQKALPFSHATVQAIATQVVSSEGQHYDEVSIHFVDTKEIIDLHQKFFDDPTPTDCISFPLDEPEAAGYKVLGDVFVCPEVAITYAKEHQQNPYEEATLYVVHGLLHLLGYDDIDDTEREKMRDAEARHLKSLKKLGLSLHKPNAL